MAAIDSEQSAGRNDEENLRVYRETFDRAVIALQGVPLEYFTEEVVEAAKPFVRSAVHEHWREPYVRMNPKTPSEADPKTWEPRWKKTNDSPWISEQLNKSLAREQLSYFRMHSEPEKKQTIPEVDIAALSYTDLPKDWQEKNNHMGDYVLNLVIDSWRTNQLSTDFLDEGANKIHIEWLKQNPHAKDDPRLNRDFFSLDLDEQNKDRALIVAAVKALQEQLHLV